MPFVSLLKTETSTETIRFLKEVFTVHCVPKRLFSDNGPQYASREFKEFARTWEFEHRTSSPRCAQSNRFIDITVGCIKTILAKSAESGTDPFLALLCLRATPIDMQTPGPAKLLFGRRV